MTKTPFYKILDVNDSEDVLVNTTDFDGLREFIRGLWENDDDSDDAEKAFSIANNPASTLDDLNEVVACCAFWFEKEEGK